jgi:transcriptional regulator with XRE-family HTH domain
MKKARWLVDAEKLSARRIARGMTCAELARRSGVSVRTLGRYESGAAKLGELEQLRCVARVLHVSLEGIARPAEAAPPPPALVADGGGPNAYAPPQERARLLASTQLEKIVTLEGTLAPPRPVIYAGEPVQVLTARKLQNVFSAFATYEGERFAVIGRVAKQRGASPLEAKMIGSRHGVAVRFLLVRSITDGVDIQVTVHTAAARETRTLQRVFEEEREVCAIVKVRLASEEAQREEKGFDFFLSPKPLPWAFVVEAIA